MAKSADELEAQRDITAAYIAADADTVTPHRASRTPDGAGGWTTTPATPQQPVQVRLQPAGSRVGGPLERTTPDGRVVLPTMEIVAAHDADLQVGDTFTWSGREFEIIWLSPDTEYETFGEVLEGGR